MEVEKFGVLDKMWYNKNGDGPSPSGKALGFGPSIRRFESCRSSHIGNE